MKIYYQTRSRRKGTVAILVTLSLIGMIAVIGLAIDGGNLYQQRRLMQNAADASSLAGAEILGGTTPTDATVMAAVRTYAGYNYVANPATDLIVSYTDQYGNVIQPITTSATAPPSNAVGVQVTAQRTVASFFLGILGIHFYTAAATSAADVVGCTSPGAGAGIVALRTGNVLGSGEIMWSASNWNYTGGVHSNSDVHIAGGGNTINGPLTTVAGTDVTGGNFVMSSPTYPVPTIAPVAPDPVNIPLSHFYQGTTNSTYYHYITGSPVTLSNYITNGVLADGIYYVNGDVSMGGALSTTVTSHVTIVATGSIKFAIGGFNWEPYDSSGILAYSNDTDMKLPAKNPPEYGGSFQLSMAGHNGIWGGTLYAPNGGINFTGSWMNVTAGSLVAQKMTLSGSNDNFTSSGSGSSCTSTTNPGVFLYK